MPNPPLEIRLRVLAAVDVASGSTIRERIRAVSQQSFVDHQSGQVYQFTWRTISTWLYRYKTKGITTLETKTRSDKCAQRKVQVAELAEALNEVLPTLSLNKVGKVPKSTLYRCLLERNYFTRQQLAPTTFYRFVREHDLLDQEKTQKMRLAFAMQHANELWQGDTLKRDCSSRLYQSAYPVWSQYNTFSLSRPLLQNTNSDGDCTANCICCATITNSPLIDLRKSTASRCKNTVTSSDQVIMRALSVIAPALSTPECEAIPTSPAQHEP